MLDVKDNKVLISFDSDKDGETGGDGTNTNTLPYKADLFNEPFNIEDPLTGAASVVQHPGLNGAGLAGLLQLTTPASGTAPAAPTAVDAAPIVAAVADAAAATRTGSAGDARGSNSTDDTAAKKAKVCKAGSRRALVDQPQRYLWCVSGRELEMQCSIGTSFCADQQTCCKFDDDAYSKAQQDYVQGAEEEQAAAASGDRATTAVSPPTSTAAPVSPIVPFLVSASDVIASSPVATPGTVNGGQSPVQIPLIHQQPLLQQQNPVAANQQLLFAPTTNIVSSLPDATLTANVPAANLQVSLAGVNDGSLLTPNSNIHVASPSAGILQPTLQQQQPVVSSASALNAALSPQQPVDGPVLRELNSAFASPAVAEAKTPQTSVALSSPNTDTLHPPSQMPVILSQQSAGEGGGSATVSAGQGQRKKVTLPNNNSYTIHIALNQNQPETPATTTS